MRNPLDAIVSMLRKANVISADSEDFNFEKFCNVSRWMLDQLRLWIPATKHLRTFCYDQITTNPIKEIKNIMHQLKIKPNSETANKIWEELGYKQLPSAPKKHFWQGGAGKWQKYFKATHLSFLKFYGVEEILESFGYRDILHNFRVLTNTLPPDLWKKSCSTEHLETMETPVKNVFGNEDFDTLSYAKHFHGENHIKVTDKLYLATDAAPPAEFVNELAQAKFLNQLAAAGAHPDKRYV